MARRPNQSESATAFLAHCGINGSNCGSGCEPRNFKRFRTDTCIHIQIRFTVVAGGLDLKNQIFAVAACDVLVCGSMRHTANELARKLFIVIEGAHDRLQATCVFGMDSCIVLQI